MTARQEQEQRRTPAGLRRRAELMEAAVLLAADQGFGRTRVSDIVGRVGVGQGVFYWYFDSKDALFREIFEDMGRRLRLFQGAFIADETDPLRRIAKGIIASFDFIVRNAHVFAVLDHVSAGARRQRNPGGNVHLMDTAKHIAEAIRAGEVRPMETEFPARAISGVVDHLARDYFRRHGDLDATIQEGIDFCLGGLLGPRTMTVAELRAEVEITPELERIRDKVGASLNGDHGDGGRRRSRADAQRHA
jgi:AcrR family transcriptional regulator